MIFTLEVMQADHGDCLVLHYGDKKSPKFIVIDGGPSGIYKKVLKPRLLEIKEKFSDDAPLPLSMVMVSHMDDDHVNGILAMTDEAVDKKSDNRQPDFLLQNLWFNAFDDIVGNAQVPGVTGAAAGAADLNAVPVFSGLEHHEMAVIASTGQGRRLRDNALTLGVMVNSPFKELKKGKANLVRGDEKESKLTWDKSLKITVIHPNTQRLNELQAQWDKDLKTLAKKKGSGIEITSLGDKDTSPFNLSSIVCLVEFGDKTILLTGDARSDDILAGLKANKLLDKKGKLHVNILKMPHHGSERDLSPDFFETVTADHFVISANGKFNNPDKSTLEVMADMNKSGNPCTLHLTNHDGVLDLKEKVDAIVKRMEKEGNKMKISFREKDADSIVLNLLDTLNY